jgi:hypothetical protein
MVNSQKMKERTVVNKAKIKGTSWETDNVRFLSRFWPKIKRAALEGTGDVGDLTHPETWAVECKNRAPINLPQFLREAEAEAQNKGVALFVALVKNRRSKGETGRVEDGYAVTRTRVWAKVAYEHERRGEALDHLLALRQRWEDKALTDSAFAVLASEALRDMVSSFHDTALRCRDANIGNENDA